MIMEKTYLIPKEGTLERIMLDAMIAAGPGSGVTFADLDGTGITEENIEQIANNLRRGMFEAENDFTVRFDS